MLLNTYSDTHSSENSPYIKLCINLTPVNFLFGTFQWWSASLVTPHRIITLLDSVVWSYKIIKVLFHQVRFINLLMFSGQRKKKSWLTDKAHRTQLLGFLLDFGWSQKKLIKGARKREVSTDPAAAFHVVRRMLVQWWGPDQTVTLQTSEWRGTLSKSHQHSHLCLIRHSPDYYHHL